jgi:hypothetical protein
VRRPSSDGPSMRAASGSPTPCRSDRDLISLTSTAPPATGRSRARDAHP